VADDKAYRARYKLLHEQIQKQAAVWLSSIEAEEAALAKILRSIPPEFVDLPVMIAVKRDMFAMKDNAHKIKKVLRTLSRRTKVTASPMLAKNADVKFLKKLTAKHLLTFKQIHKNVAALDAQRAQLQKLIAGKSEDG
jgi:hypothetical protein